MQHFMQRKLNRLMEEVKPEGGAGGGSEKEPQAEQTPPADPPKPEENGKKFDDFGYEVDEKKGEAGENDKEKEPSKKPEEEEGVKDPATGYGEEPPKVDEEPEKKPEEKEPDEKDKELAALNVEGLEDDEVKKIKEFAKKHGVSKEAAQELLDQRKEENKAVEQAIADNKAQRERDVLKRRADWHKELRDDVDFGGEKFAFNLKRVEKTLQEFFPGTKKMLTERGGMLPPYVMRDLGKLAEKLYSQENLPQGSPNEKQVEDDKSDDPLAFYEQG